MHQVSTPYPFTALAPPSFPSRPGSSILIDCRSEGTLTVDNYARRWASTSEDIRSRCRRQLITFDMLSDDVLLEIFDSYVDEDIDQDVGQGFGLSKEQRIAEWITLAHVCRRWRRVVFQSPLRLNLRLLCTPKTRARDTLDIWPPLPLIISDADYIFDNRSSSVDNIIAALEHNNRVCQIGFSYLSSSHSVAMQKPFPELTDLQLSMDVLDGPGPILPDSFLGGTAPRLRSLGLCNVPFPGLPKLLLSATHLVKLDLLYIPRSGYIPPDAIATSLSALNSLESLFLHFRYPRSLPALESRRPPLLTRTILPSLTKIRFKGDSEYLEEILARIDAPRLDELHITFFNQIIFDTPQLFQFISRRPTLRAPTKGHIAFSSRDVFVGLSQTSDYETLSMRILCTASEWQLSSLEQVCTSSLPPFSMLKDLYIFEDRINPPRWQGDVENTLWLEFLRPFAAVKNLYPCKEFLPRIAPPLQELVGESMIEFLPTLENIFLEFSLPSGRDKELHEGIERFVTARRLTSHPVAVSRRHMNWFREIRPVTISRWHKIHDW